MAYALMRPEGIDGMELKGFKKKFKDKKFAAGCSRNVIKQGFDMLGLDPNLVMQLCIDGMTRYKKNWGWKIIRQRPFGREVFFHARSKQKEEPPPPFISISCQAQLFLKQVPPPEGPPLRKQGLLSDDP